MEPVRKLTQNGQELVTGAYNQNVTTAAQAPDKAIQELFRPGTGYATAARGVIPYGFTGGDGANPTVAGIVTSSGSNNAKVRVYPFRAVIGPQGDADPVTAWRTARTVSCVPAAGSNLYSEVTLSATVSNNRIDLLWVKVTLGTATNTGSNYVRDPSTGNITNPTLTLEEGDTFSFGIQSGAESASPSLPVIPADSGSDYYIPLAYIYLTHPFTSSTKVEDYLIKEVSTVYSQNGATGVASMRPATLNSSPASPVVANQFSLSGRTDSYLPPTMVGMESRLIPLQFDRATKVPPLAATTIVDSSIDWRNRVFKWAAIANTSGGGTLKFAWGSEGAASSTGGHIPYYVDHMGDGLGTKMQIGWGQSFYEDAASERVVANLSPTVLSVMGAGIVRLFVDSTGTLKVAVSGGDPACNILIWLDATGPFPNAA